MSKNEGKNKSEAKNKDKGKGEVSLTQLFS